MKKFGRTDANHVKIVKALRDARCSVVSLAPLGSGVPDLLVARCGVMWLIEVKDGTKPPSQRRLTPDQLEWISKWKAHVYVVESVGEALKVVTVL